MPTELWAQRKFRSKSTKTEGRGEQSPLFFYAHRNQFLIRVPPVRSTAHRLVWLAKQDSQCSFRRVGERYKHPHPKPVPYLRTACGNQFSVERPIRRIAEWYKHVWLAYHL
jgi:hypothetical protein